MITSNPKMLTMSLMLRLQATASLVYIQRRWSRWEITMVKAVLGKRFERLRA